MRVSRGFASPRTSIRRRTRSAGSARLSLRHYADRVSCTELDAGTHPSLNSALVDNGSSRHILERGSRTVENDHLFRARTSGLGTADYLSQLGMDVITRHRSSGDCMTHVAHRHRL